jgi:hypothetical protein
VALASITLVLAGCSSSSKPPGKASSRSTTTTREASPTSSAEQSAETSTSTPSTPSCGLVPASEVNDALGFNVQSPSSQVNGPVTVCTYNGSPGSVIVRFQTGEDASTFAADKQRSQQNGELTTDVPGLADAAYSSQVGSGRSQSNTLVVLKGSTELLITASATFDDINALARQILPSI